MVWPRPAQAAQRSGSAINGVSPWPASISAARSRSAWWSH
jgi:hypothetical protein